MVHRVYDFTLPHSAQITNNEKEGIFIPSGFDSIRLISELGKMDKKNKGGVDSADSDDANNEQDFEKPFEEVLNQAMF